MSNNELLTYQQLKALPPQQWIMQPNMIPAEGLVILYGPPSSGKSFVALDWALCFATGQSWLGRFPVQKCPVIYIAAEGGSGITKRVVAWADHYGHADLPGAYFLLHPLAVREEGAVDAFLDSLDDMLIVEDDGDVSGIADLNPGIIIIDTLSRSFGGGDENASTDMADFVDKVVDLAKVKHVAVLVVHHTNATGGRERGHSALRGGADTMFACKAFEDKESGRLISLCLTNDKQKDDAKQPPIHMRPVAVRKSIVLEETEAPEKEKTPKEEAAMRKSDMLRVLACSEDGYTWQEWKLACGIDKPLFNRRLKQFQDLGEIYKENGRYRIMPATKDLAEDE
jgi:RecA-family ATPase